MGTARISAQLGLALATVLPASAWATLGGYEHGAGIKAMGAGGVGYALGGDTIAMASNPSLAIGAAGRYDIGYDVFKPEVEASYREVPDAPDPVHTNDGRHWYGVPQAGVSWAPGPRWAAGATLISAGLGPDYDGSPYARFGGAPRASLSIMQTSLALALAYAPNARQRIGISITPAYQAFEAKGLQPFEAASSSPDKVTDRGRDSVFGVGFAVGWNGELLPGLSAGLAWHSKTWTQRQTKYKGLIPDGGRLEFPANFGAGLAYRVRPGLVAAFDVQRYWWTSEAAFGNGIAQLDEGKPLGSADGPGFGFGNQTAYKLGVEWQASAQWSLRAGYVAAKQMLRSSDTLFGFLGPVIPTTHYTVGSSYRFGRWEASGYAAYAPAQTVRGQGSIPASFGGGEADVSGKMYMFGLSIGRSFAAR